ncbi:MAG: hypothetical protein HOV83_25270, partial [Catenulispora sp.]|nr:hypothetical protein [Catenulispora sp.]
AVVVLGGAVALATSACGGPMQAGAAAVVQGQRTSDRDVQSRSAAFVSLLVKNGAAQESDISDGTRAAVAKAQVSQLVRTAVWQRAADDLGLAVGADADAKVRGELVGKARTELGKNFHGSDDEAVALADAQTQNASALAPSGVPAFIHYQALYQAVINGEAAKLHVSPDLTAQTGPQLQQGVVAALDKAAKEIDVKISPRYGDYDPDTRQVVAADTSWIHPTKDQIANAMAQMQQPPQ